VQREHAGARVVAELTISPLKRESACCSQSRRCCIACGPIRSSA